MNKHDIETVLRLRHSSRKTNYYKASLQQLEEIHAEFKDRKPKILVHACCAVCASWPIEFLAEHFDVTIFYNNSNIYPKEEYERRLGEGRRYIDAFGRNVHLIVVPYDNEAYTARLAPMKDDPEGFGRCFYCYTVRMKEAYAYAAEHGYDFFTTVMSISRQKDSQKMNEIGIALSHLYPSVRYFCSDFKKGGGQERSRELSDQYGFYRQDYCGCIYSYEARNARKE